MKSAIRICTLLIAFNVVHGSKNTDSVVLKTENPFPGEDIFYSKEVWYQSKIELDQLYLVNIKKGAPPSCTLKNEKINDSDIVKGVKKIPQGAQVLVHLNKNIVIINTRHQGSTCYIDFIIEAECMIVATRAESFDCIPRFPTNKLVERYTYEGNKTDSFKISEDHENITNIEFESTDLEEPNEKKKVLLWEFVRDSEKPLLKVLDSDYKKIQGKDKPNLSPPEFHSFDHGRLTACRRNVHYKRRDNPKFIECAMIDLNNFQNTAVEQIEPPKNTKPEQTTTRTMVVQNLSGGGALILYNRGYEYPPSKELFYRVISAKGKLMNEEKIFYEFDDLDYRDFSVHAYEKDGNVCGVIFDSFNIATKCVKVDAI